MLRYDTLTPINVLIGGRGRKFTDKCIFCRYDKTLMHVDVRVLQIYYLCFQAFYSPIPHVVRLQKFTSSVLVCYSAKLTDSLI